MSKDFKDGVHDATSDTVVYVDDNDLASQEAFDNRLRDGLGEARMERFTEYAARIENVAEADLISHLHDELQTTFAPGAAFSLIGEDADYCIVRVPSEELDSMSELIGHIKEELASERIQEHLQEEGLTEADVFDESRLNQEAIDQVTQEEYNRLVGIHEGSHCEAFLNEDDLLNLAERLDVPTEKLQEIVDQANHMNVDLTTTKVMVSEYLADHAAYEDAIESGNDHLVEAHTSLREAAVYDDEHPVHERDEIDRMKQSASDPADNDGREMTEPEQDPVDLSAAPSLRDSFSAAAGVGHVHLHHDHSHGLSVPEGHAYGNEVAADEIAHVVEDPAIASAGDPALLQAGGVTPQAPAPAPGTAPEVEQPQPVQMNMATP